MLASLKQKLCKTPLWKLAKIAVNDRRKYNFLGKIKSANKDSAILRILVINHFFDGEIEAMTRLFQSRPDVSILCVTPEPFFTRGVAWFPESVHCAKIAYDAPELEPVRQRFRAYCETLRLEISARFSFDCILTPSDSFYWLREFIVACREQGIPTIVADKEGTISPRSFDVEPLRIKQMFPPISDYFFVWSKRQSAFWLKAGVEHSRIFVVGSMRSDLFATLSPQMPSTLLCFDFDTDAYINNMDWVALGWQGERNWNYLRDAIHRVLLGIATDHPELKIIIKCHPQQVVTDFPTAGLLDQPNVSIVKGVPRGLPAMIADAHAIIGFQTTALLEAALARKPVLYVAWGDLYKLVEPQILPWADSGYGMTWIQSEKQLDEALRRILNRASGDLPVEVDRSRLANYFHQADGHVTERLLDCLEEVVGKYKADELAV
jgi:hypothetical protein